MNDANLLSSNSRQTDETLEDQRDDIKVSFAVRGGGFAELLRMKKVYYKKSKKKGEGLIESE